MRREDARTLATLLDQEEIFIYVADEIMLARDKAKRCVGDRDSAEVLQDVVDALKKHY